MRAVLAVAIAIAGILPTVSAQPVGPPSLQDLYNAHRWFELRDAIPGKSVSPLYAGAVAAALDDVANAETLLTRAIRDAATPEAANEAREALLELYMRHSRTADAVRILDEGLAAAPSRDDFRNARSLFAAFSRLPNQTVSKRSSRPFRCTVKPDGVFLPAFVNGKPVEWLFDSGFSHSSMTESEAHRLGVTVHAGSAQAGDFASGTTSTRSGVAQRMAIGDAELRNVPVLVFPDSQPPWNEFPPGKQGAIGLPVALALGGIHWTAGGTCTVGANSSSRGSERNLMFDGSTPIARVWIERTPLDVVLDSGNQSTTQLWERFAADMPHLIALGAKTTQQVSQIGGTRQRDVVAIPELRLRVGGFESVLKPALVFSKPIGDGFHHGNIGMEVLRQASDVTIDFQSMSLAVR